MTSKHDKTSHRLARKEGVEYNRGQGPDIKAKRRVIEVESEGTVNDGKRQLQGYRKPVYIAGADDAATKAAMDATKGTTIGVMTAQGKIVKPSSRGR